MSDATVKLMDITSDMSSALRAGADDGRATQRNGKRARRMNDLIKREDVLKELQLDHKDVIYIDKNECARRIKAIPSADRPQGEWIDAEIPLECGGSMPIQVCNLCKTFYPLAYTGGGHRFCPNCGCRMKGADDE